MLKDLMDAAFRTEGHADDDTAAAERQALPEAATNYYYSIYQGSHQHRGTGS